MIAGRDYGSGSSRDWAAKGPLLLGVRAVIAASYERIHRSNLVGMGILPLQFEDGVDAASLGLSGRETFEVEALQDAVAMPWGPERRVHVHASAEGSAPREFQARVRIDTPQELLYYRHGGILVYVLRQLMHRERPEVAPGGLAAGHVRHEETVPLEVEQGSAESFPASDPPSY